MVLIAEGARNVVSIDFYEKVCYNGSMGSCSPVFFKNCLVSLSSFLFFGNLDSVEFIWRWAGRCPSGRWG